MMTPRPETRDRPDPRAGATRTTTEREVDAHSIDDPADVPRCRRCHRPLHSDLATAAGFGPVCAQYVIGGAPKRVRVQLAGQTALPGMEVAA
jgi:hypothetical protein